ncbi:MAG: sigma-70 family RNA polymerase sigma factor [Flavobacteriales bacterium]|nr:sigma-70 family RNA polymerase sigma factor [Flavobacteriales bacterium]
MVYQHMHQDLIELCRHGDRNAQLKLYKLYYKAMYNTSLRIVKNEAEAEDLMQESFLDAFRKLDTYKGDASFGSWLKRIVINNSLDALKKRKINWESLDDGYKEPYLVQEETAPEEVDQWKVEEVKKSIAQLPDGYRTILSLYLLEGYDHDEIASILHITSSTSRSQFNRAKNKLREILKERTWQTI